MLHKVSAFQYPFPLQSMLLFVVGTIGSSMLCYATPYTPETLPAKIGAFILFTSIMGVTMAPLISIAGTGVHVLYILYIHVHVHVHVYLRACIHVHTCM